MMKTTSIDTIAIVGAHGSGKSTIGRMLAAQLGWSFDLEIGEILRRECLAKDPTAHAGKPQPGFDREVTSREMCRDLLSTVPRVVETWHPGNLAYAQMRSIAAARPIELQVSRPPRQFEGLRARIRGSGAGVQGFGAGVPGSGAGG